MSRLFRILNVERLTDMVRITIKDGTIIFQPDEVPADLTDQTCANYVLTEEWVRAESWGWKEWKAEYDFERR